MKSFSQTVISQTCCTVFSLTHTKMASHHHVASGAASFRSRLESVMLFKGKTVAVKCVCLLAMKTDI